MQVEDAERILDELEEIARSDIPSRQFFDQLIASLRLLVEARSAAILVRLPHAGWIITASDGAANNHLLLPFASRVKVEPDSRVLESVEGNSAWLAYPIHPAHWDSGALLIHFAHSIPPGAGSAVSAVARAFAEVLLVRHSSRIEQLFGKSLNAFQQLNHHLATSNSLIQSASLLANQLVPILSAARVSVISATQALAGRTSLLSVSGTDSIDKSSPAVRSILSLATDALGKSGPLIRQSAPTKGQSRARKIREDGTFENVLVLRLGSDERDEECNTRRDQSLLLIEWEDSPEMVEAMYAVIQFIPIVATTWQLQVRWLRIPYLLRTLWSRRSLSQSRMLDSRLLKATAAVVCATLVGWGLIQPVTMSIEAPAVLEPSISRTIFANTDGFLLRLHVDDSQSVKAGELLAELRSPTLDLQIEEVVGQIKSIAEKRNGLRIANAQSDSANDDSAASQTRISSEILLLDTQEKHARGKLEFLNRERDQLSIRSPIDGQVVSRNVKQELESRPLRRGDALFSVMDVQGQWQLNIRVADRDTVYLTKHYGDQRGEITFVLDSDPGVKVKGEVIAIGRMVENAMGTGGSLQVLASIPNDLAAKAHLGATAQATFACGTEPLWFVWCRPAVEAIQKRFWLFTR